MRISKHRLEEMLRQSSGPAPAGRASGNSACLAIGEKGGRE